MNCLMLHCPEMKQQSNTALSSIRRLLIYHPTTQHSLIICLCSTACLKFQCSIVICTPEFTLTCAGNGVSQDIPCILFFHYKSTSLLVSILAVIGILLALEMHLVVGHGLFATEIPLSI